MEKQIKKEFLNKKKYLLKLKKDKIINYFFEYGYYGERYSLPPIFKISNFDKILDKDFISKNKKVYYELLNIEIRHTDKSKRVFSLIHPNIYHDLVKVIVEQWDCIIEHIFDDNLKIYSHSFPIPTTKLKKKKDNNMIYNFLAIEEKIIRDSYNYKYILKVDISKFYHSIYTHSISWALYGREEAFKIKDRLDYLGNKLDYLLQKANHRQTNGIPVSPMTSDIIAEIILSSIDKSVSSIDKIKEMDFIATRYKDDYRFLCNTKEDAKYILEILEEKLRLYNLWINKEKTKIEKLPSGLERKWIKEYDTFCTLDDKNFSTKKFKNAYFYLIEIEEKYPGSAMYSKFLDNLIINSNVIFSKEKLKNKIEIINLLSLLIDYSPRILPQLLAIIELLINDENKDKKLISFIMNFINKMYYHLANDKKIDEFRLVWVYFFAKKHNIKLVKIDNENFNNILKNNIYIKYIDKKKSIFDNIHESFNLYTENNWNNFIYNHITIYGNEIKNKKSKNNKRSNTYKSPT